MSTVTITTLAHLRRAHAKAEKALVRAALKAHGWHLRNTAAVLKVDKETLRRLITRLGLGKEYERLNVGKGFLGTSRGPTHPLVSEAEYQRKVASSLAAEAAYKARTTRG